MEFSAVDNQCQMILIHDERAFAVCPAPFKKKIIIKIIEIYMKSFS